MMRCYAHLDGDLRLTAADVERDVVAYVKLFMLKPEQALLNPVNRALGQQLQKTCPGIRVEYPPSVSLWELRLGPMPVTPATPRVSHVEELEQPFVSIQAPVKTEAKAPSPKRRGLWYICQQCGFQTNVLADLVEHHAAHHDMYIYGRDPKEGEEIEHGTANHHSDNSEVAYRVDARGDYGSGS